MVDALCGTSGAGALINELFLARMGAALETIYFNELDFIFGKLHFLARSPAESYPYNPMTDLLTAEQWDEVQVKDSWYRARIRDFFVAVSLGGTPDGLRMAVHSAVGTDADLYEVWRYRDNFGITDDLGRSNARNEVVIRPHKATLAPVEMRLLRDMLTKLAPLDTIVTVNPNGLAVVSPVPVQAAAATSSYYEVQKTVQATPVLDQIPDEALLGLGLLLSEQWLLEAKRLKRPKRAPHSAFNMCCEYSLHYLAGGDKRAPIDSVVYGTLNSDGSISLMPNYQVFSTTGQYTDRIPYEKADSPDNYPGGKFGQHPDSAPALNPDGTVYHFQYASQAAYITAKTLEVQAMGGYADATGYQLPIQQPNSTPKVFMPQEAIASTPPAMDSTITTAPSWRRGNTTILQPEITDPKNFVRS